MQEHDIQSIKSLCIDEKTKTCPMCKKEKPVSAYPIIRSGRQQGQPYAYCRPCNVKRGSDWNHKSGFYRPMSEAKDSSLYLGVVVAERVLSHYFEDVQRMPHNNPGYDFICKNGFKIDAKSACRRKGRRDRTGRSDVWFFATKHNIVADYFFFLAFEERMSLKPEHVWLIPTKELNHLAYFSIAESRLAKWSKYEKPLDKVIACCSVLRSEAI